jgi:HAD superfamily hydrolase (TIGR01549 family)
MIVNKKQNNIFDFDGTIVNLEVDWDGLKKEVNFIYNSISNKISNSLNEKIDYLKNKNVNIYQILSNYEQNNNIINYTIIHNIYEKIIHLDEFYIISNNLHSTIERVITEIGLSNKCKKIIGIDDVIFSKPNINGFEILKSSLIHQESLYVGDRESDNEFAIRCNMNFKFTNQI